MSVMIDQEDLMAALSRVKPAVAHSKMNELFRCVVFRNDRLMSFNGNSGIVTKSGISGVHLAVDADKFVQIVSQLSGQVVLDQQDGSLVITNNRARFKISTAPASRFPDFVPTGMVRWCKSNDFVDAIRKVSFTICNDLSRAALVGVGVRGPYVYSLDGKRITRARMTEPATSPAVLSVQTANHLMKFGQPDSVLIGHGHIGAHWSSEDTLYVGALMQSNFPFDAIDGLFSTPPSEDYVVKIPTDLAKAIKLVTPVLDTSTSIEVENDGEQLILSATSQFGEAKHSLPWEFKHKFKISIDSAFLLQAVLRFSFIDFSDVLVGNKRSLGFFDNTTEHKTALSA